MKTRTLCVFVKRRSRLANWDVAMVVGRARDIQAEGQVDGQVGEGGCGWGCEIRDTG